MSWSGHPYCQYISPSIIFMSTVWTHITRFSFLTGNTVPTRSPPILSKNFPTPFREPYESTHYPSKPFVQQNGKLVCYMCLMTCTTNLTSRSWSYSPTSLWRVRPDCRGTTPLMMWWLVHRNPFSESYHYHNYYLYYHLYLYYYHHYFYYTTMSHQQSWLTRTTPQSCLRPCSIHEVTSTHVPSMVSNFTTLWQQDQPLIEDGTWGTYRRETWWYGEMLGRWLSNYKIISSLVFWDEVGVPDVNKTTHPRVV